MCSLEDLPPEIRAQILRSINYHVDLCSAIYSNKSLFMVVFELLETLFCQEISQIQRSRGLKFAVAYAIEAIEQTTASYIEKILLCVEISVVLQLFAKTLATALRRQIKIWSPHQNWVGAPYHNM